MKMMVQMCSSNLGVFPSDRGMHKEEEAQIL